VPGESLPEASRTNVHQPRDDVFFDAVARKAAKDRCHSAAVVTIEIDQSKEQVFSVIGEIKN
jgi:hypothetical protein